MVFGISLSLDQRGDGLGYSLDTLLLFSRLTLQHIQAESVEVALLNRAYSVSSSQL